MKRFGFVTFLFCLLLAGCNITAPKPPKKVWLHRTNSLEKLKEQSDEYRNFEVDVTIRPGARLDVTHDADTSFNLALDSYFPYLKGRKMWVDIKNLTPVNSDSVRAHLNGLVTKYRLKRKQFIIESDSWSALKPFTDEGWYTSFYIHFPEPTDLDDDELEFALDSLRTIADGGTVRALSFPADWYYTLSRKLERGIDLLTWKHHTLWQDIATTASGREMLRDPQLKVILVKDKGHFHR